MPVEGEIRKSAPDYERVSHFFGVITERRTYLGLIYLFLAFPLGQLYFILYLFAFAFGIALSFLIIGIPILFAALVGARYIGAFERVLANSLLGTDIRRPEPIHSDELWGTAVAYVRDGNTWRSLGFISLKFWFGLLSFILLLVGFISVFALIFAPVADSELLGWTIDSTVEEILAVPLGVILLFVLLHICNAAASLSGIAATALLDGSGERGSEHSQPPTDRTAREPIAPERRRRTSQHRKEPHDDDRLGEPDGRSNDGRNMR